MKAAIALIVVVFALSCTSVVHARSLTAQQIRYWDAIARCETGGNWRMSGSSFEGGVGFAVTTWRWWASELGLVGRYPHAYMAPRLVQMQVAQMGYDRHRGYWGCASVVGG